MGTKSRYRVQIHRSVVQNDLPDLPLILQDATEFCARLSQLTGRDYRLPSEVEWEYACRAGTTTPFHFGETITTDLANYDGTDGGDGRWKGNYGQGPKGIDPVNEVISQWIR